MNGTINNGNADGVDEESQQESAPPAEAAAHPSGNSNKPLWNRFVYCCCRFLASVFECSCRELWNRFVACCCRFLASMLERAQQLHCLSLSLIPTRGVLFVIEELLRIFVYFIECILFTIEELLRMFVYLMGCIFLSGPIGALLGAPNFCWWFGVLPKGEGLILPRLCAEIWSYLKNSYSPPRYDIPEGQLRQKEMLLAGVKHVMKGTVDEDGLECVVPLHVGKISHKKTWPYENCHCKNWGFDTKHGLHICKDGDNPCTCPEREHEIHKLWDKARECLKESDGQGNLDKAVANFSQIVQESPSGPVTFAQQALAMCDLGILLSSHLELKVPHRFSKNDRNAVLLFKIGAVAFRSPYCMYMYGHALDHGQGGVIKNQAKSIE